MVALGFALQDVVVDALPPQILHVDLGCFECSAECLLLKQGRFIFGPDRLDGLGGLGVELGPGVFQSGPVRHHLRMLVPVFVQQCRTLALELDDPCLGGDDLRILTDRRNRVRRAVIAGSDVIVEGLSLRTLGSRPHQIVVQLV